VCGVLVSPLDAQPMVAQASASVSLNASSASMNKDPGLSHLRDPLQIKCVDFNVLFFPCIISEQRPLYSYFLINQSVLL
jgi:hypothetical protein